VEIVREVSIECPVEELFAFVADARNDKHWCSKVRSVEQVSGDGPGPNSPYAIVHKPGRRLAPASRAPDDAGVRRLAGAWAAAGYQR
jgi:hypothetical protein